MNFSRTITTVDMHVAGEPLRIITDGLPQIKGETQPERRAYCIKHLDYIRRFLMHEPRGHEGMYGCIITPPAHEGSDFGVLFMHNEGWSTMCGHGIIAVVTMGIETGMFDISKSNRRFVIDSPAGKVVAYAEHDGDKVVSVSFENVPSFLYLDNIDLNVNGINLKANVSFGGAFYVILNNNLLNLTQGVENLTEFKNLATQIKKDVESRFEIQHPLQEDLNGIYGVIYSEDLSGNIWKNITMFADRQVDRSPCGTGTSAKAAELGAALKLKIGEAFVHQSITGGQFRCRLEYQNKVGKYDAVVTTITGTAKITGFNRFVLETEDELSEGFLLQ